MRLPTCDEVVADFHAQRLEQRKLRDINQLPFECRRQQLSRFRVLQRGAQARGEICREPGLKANQARGRIACPFPAGSPSALQSSLVHWRIMRAAARSDKVPCCALAPPFLIAVRSRDGNNARSYHCPGSIWR